ITAGFMAVSSVFIEYSTNARGYTLQTVLLLMVIVLANALQKRSRPALWLCLVIFSVMGFYTVPTMLYGWGAVMLWMLLTFLIEHSGRERIYRIRLLFIAGITTAI